MLATGRSDRHGANGRDKNGRGGARKGGAVGAGARFEVLGRAGEGTLWIVYRVKERANGDVLALKALKGVFNRHPRFPIALLGACERWRDVEHPNIAAPREGGQEDGTLFITSEWLPGGALETRMNRAQTRDEIVGVLRACASALAYLHEREMTHGDLRARQLVYDAGGHLKLTDGGTAEAFAASGLALADVQPDAAWYLAPERTQGASLAPPADLYALGVLLYRMLAGRVPFDGPSPLSIALRHRSDTPLPPSQFNPRCPSDLENLALRLLEKDPDKRPTAAAVERALQTLAPTAGDALPITPTTGAISPPIPAKPTIIAEPEGEIEVEMPRRRAIAPMVEEKLAEQTEEELKIDLKTRRKRHKRREFWGAFGALIWLIIVLGAFGGMFYGAYYYWVDQTPKQVRVPSYVGLKQDDAIQALAKAGLTMTVGRETYDAKKPEGTVMSGEPEPGRLVRAHRDVTVTISQGEAPITMVDFSELPLAQARQIIAEHAMRLGSVQEQFHDKVPRGYICGQFPESGTPFRRSEPITLIVSRGPQPTEIDATTGQVPLDDATADQAQPPVDNPVPFQTSQPVSAKDVVARVALIRVQIPADGGSQLVRVIVQDADGERTVYSKTHKPGDEVRERVHVRRPQGQTALVRIYVGAALIKQEHL